MPDILLATKIYIPPLRRNLIIRPQLVQRLNDGIEQNRRLTYISAPAGYGKSTLLSQWVSQLDRPVAWLSLEKEDNAPSRFWSYFVYALHSIPGLQQAGIGETMLQAWQSPQPPPTETLLANLLNDLAQLKDRVLLVLDDLHAITEGQIHQGLVFLIDHLPRSESGLHLVIASRMDPPWPMARWRAHSELTEVRAVDLRFSLDEVKIFLNDIMLLKLDVREITLLGQRTEGWIAGLQMAALLMQGRLREQGSSGVASFIETFSSSNRFILDYLMEEVISQQPGEMRDFLQATSILEQFTASLCDALLGRQDSQTILDQVEQANLFLIPLDEERRWYRYHHLFADLLRKHLKQTQPEKICELHQRASDWFSENNFLAEAIDHALDAGDIGRVNRFVSGNALAMVEHAELQGVLQHFEQMSEQEICSKPWLCVAYAWVKAYVDPSQEIGQIITRSMEGISEVEDALERQHLISHLDAIWAYVAWVKGEPDKALEFARSALAGLPAEDWMTRTHVLNIEGLAFQYLGDLPAAIQSFEAAAGAGQRTGKAYESFHAYTNWAYAEVLRGRLHQAYSLCQQVLSLAEKDGLHSKGLPVLAYAYTTLSLVQLEWNNVESALQNARQGVALAEQWNQADTLHFSLSCLSDALNAAGNSVEAYTVNQRSMLLATKVSPWFVRISASDEILLNLAKGDIPAAARRFAELEPLVEKRDVIGRFMVVKVSLLFAQGSYLDVITVLDEVMDEIMHSEGFWYPMNLLSLRALALHALGREDEAVQIIISCLTRAKPEGFVRVFVKHGTPMHRLLELAVKQGVEVEYIHQLLPAFNIPATPIVSRAPGTFGTRPQHPGAALVELLSEREIQVLRLLDSPLTSEEIGRELYVSVNTIRTHMRNIYAKLGVNRRGDAVQQAKRIKLI
ncbi:MAG TPA: LuxR C-terminal-related transcriptional regulator [Anaerolineales bacterium]|nr:LuxR C-terminal-related transcriptional regulator [Anaerolineales bacterium]